MINGGMIYTAQSIKRAMHTSSIISALYNTRLMQEKETTTKNPIRNSLTKIPCRWSCERESTRKRECRKGLLSQTHTHTCRRAPSHTHANHVHAKRTAATRRTTANIQIQIQIQVQNNNKINNSPGNWNWKVGAGGGARVENWSGVAGAVAVAALAAVVVHLLPFARRLFK